VIEFVLVSLFQSHFPSCKSAKIGSGVDQLDKDQAEEADLKGLGNGEAVAELADLFIRRSFGLTDGLAGRG